MLLESTIMQKFIVLFCLIVVWTDPCKSQSDQPICVMRRVCGNTDFGLIPCNNHSEPQILTPVEANIRSLTLLEAMCPHLHTSGHPVVCCDEFQLESMFVTLYNLAHMGYNHCPQCLRNLEKLFCQMYCSTDQKQFIKSKKFKKHESKSDTHVANEIDYYLNEEYAKGIFDSCKDVRNFEGRVIDMVCGGLRGDQCFLRDWFGHLGRDIENEGLSPFTINFIITEETEVKDENQSFKPLNEEYIQCSEDISEKLKACDCHHCSKSCPKKDKRETKKCLMKGVCDETAFGGIPCVSDEEPTTEDKFYYMSLFRSINGATVVIFMKELSEQLLAKCEALMNTRIIGLTTKLAEIAIKISGTNSLNNDMNSKEAFKFVYFNSSNSAFKANVSALLDQRRITESDLVKLVVDIDSDLKSVIKDKNVCEIISKTTNDSWLVVHHSDDRTLFSMLNHKNANLIEASDTVNALTCKQFKNVLFVD